ncbi:DUF3048 domain-containing protein [Longirhabdus pacifica]|uniref:DUF3048 domain-containing protein n=1 Tax=Longirhabdus pacifica TaxID=2305227 RepID=UPI0013E8EEF8|nr:DUF3048 domain-containing protein [Longirhabdus pacifica]
MNVMKSAIAITCITLALSACGGGNSADPLDPLEQDVEREEFEENEEENEPTMQEITYPFHAPLTGIGMEESLEEVRPIMFMVENSPAARPQSGLHMADIVYEILAEGEITRFVAVYQSEQPEIIGPIRSIRSYFVELAYEMDTLVVHAGWSQSAMNMLVQRNIQHFDQVYGDDKYYWRSEERYAPHNLYSNIEKIMEGAEDKNYRTSWDDPLDISFTDYKEFLYTDENGTEIRSSIPLEEHIEETSNAVMNEVDTDNTEVEENKEDVGLTDTSTANKITIPYLLGYNVSYEYDAESKLYQRFMNGEAHVDKESEQPLLTKNLIVVEAAHQIVDDVGRRDVDVYGPGKGYIFQEGSEIPLYPGKTWIQFVPLETTLTFE